MLPENTTYYVNVLPSTKNEIQDFVERFENELLEGSENPLKIAVQLKAMEDLISTLRKSEKVREFIMNEVDKEPEKIIGFMGAKIEKTETGSRYNFSQCGSSKWNDLNIQIEEKKGLLKVEESYLKSLKSTEDNFHRETGEKIFPPVKTSNSFIKITLKT